MTDIDLYVQRLLETNPLRKPLLRTIIHELDLPFQSHGLDAGCGIGLQALLLLAAIGVDGHVTGLDIQPELLARAEEFVERSGLSDQITFRLGDVNQLPFEDNSFDWVWSADCVGYPAGDLTALLKELMRVVKPGGRIILLGWSAQQLLPGYPLLEARLNATCSGYIPFLKDKHPEQNFMRAVTAIERAGLKDVCAQTFLEDIRAPLDADQRTALVSLFDMLWGLPQPGASPEDLLEFKRLCQPESPDFILNIPNYYGFFTYTVIRGVVDKPLASEVSARSASHH